MLLFFPSQPGRILQARQNFASPNFCLGSRERFGAEQNQIPEFPYAYKDSYYVDKLANYISFCLIPTFTTQSIYIKF
jgi:hypothetical protein